MDDLHDRMTAGMADDGPRPPLDDLWTKGRAARRRTRAARVAGIAAALVLLVAVGVVLASAGDDEGEDVMAGPGGPSAPPAEPVDGPVQLTVLGVDQVDGTPVIVADEPFEVEVEASDEWMRGIAFDWQEWDGSGWTTTHHLVAALSGADATVVEAGEDLSVPAVGKLGAGSERLLVPDVGPGAYRVCIESTGPSEGASPSTAPDGSAPSSSEVTGPPESADEGGSSPSVTACGQARIVDDGDEGPAPTSPPEGGPTTTTGPAPPAEPTAGAVVLTAVSMPEDPPGVVHHGDPFAIAFDVREGEPAEWTRGLAARWEAWDGRDWTWTHDLTAGRDGVEGATAAPTAGGAIVEDIGFTLEQPAVFVAPSEGQATPGAHRVCLTVSGGDGGPLTVCAQLRLV